MKRSKLLVLTALLLSTLMILTSCSLFSPSLKKVLVDDAAPKGADKVYNVAEKVADLAGASVSDTDYGTGLIVFTKTGVDKELVSANKYMVYNLKSNSVVWSQTTSEKLSVSVSLDSVTVEDEEIGFFVVTETSRDNEDENAKPQITTTLYAANGSSVASANVSVTAETAADLISFNEKVYRADANGSIAFAFDYSSLANFPGVDEKVDDMYYEFDDEFIATYDEELKPVAKYRIPENEGMYYVILGNGNVLLQYVYEADPYTDDYTVLDEGTKMNVVTQIVNAKKGTAKDVKCDYVFDYMWNLEGNDIGMDAEKISVLAYAYLIEDQRIVSSHIVSINNNGKASVAGSICDEEIAEISLIAKNRWIIETISGVEYLVDENAEVIGDVTNANYFGKGFYRNGKIYDLDLNKVYDCTENDQTITGKVGDSLMLQGKDGQVLLYTGNGSPVELIGKDSEAYVKEVGYGVEFVVIRKGENFEFYNEMGNLIGTVKEVESSISSVCPLKDAVLFQTYDDESVFIRIG